MKGKSGIARAVYLTGAGKRTIIVHVFAKKTRTTPRRISAEESFKRWKKDPKYVAAYNALEKEFALASALIKARSEAEMTQEQVAEAMGTTQAVVARLESGKVLPSTRTLELFAKATRTRLRISFEPDREPCADPPRLRPIRLTSTLPLARAAMTPAPSKKKRRV